MIINNNNIQRELRSTHLNIIEMKYITTLPKKLNKRDT